MADVFICYSKQDLAVARKLSTWLEVRGWTTWGAPPSADQEAREAILSELGTSRVAVVLWSKASIASPFVVHQAIIARDANKLLHVIVPGLHPMHVPKGLHGQHLRSLDQRVIEGAVVEFSNELKGVSTST